MELKEILRKYGTKFLRKCIVKYCTLHKCKLKDLPKKKNIVFELITDIGSKRFKEIRYYSGRDATRAYMAYACYILQNDPPIDELNIRAIWYAFQGYKQFSQFLFGRKWDSEVAAALLSNSLVTMVESGDWEYLDFFIGDVSRQRSPGHSSRKPERDALKRMKGWKNVVLIGEKDARFPLIFTTPNRETDIPDILGAKVWYSSHGKSSYACVESMWHRHFEDKDDLEENPITLVGIVDFDYDGEVILNTYLEQFKRYTPHVRILHVGVTPNQIPDNRKSLRSAFYDLFKKGKDTTRIKWALKKAFWVTGASFDGEIVTSAGERIDDISFLKQKFNKLTKKYESVTYGHKKVAKDFLKFIEDQNITACGIELDAFNDSKLLDEDGWNYEIYKTLRTVFSYQSFVDWMREYYSISYSPYEVRYNLVEEMVEIYDSPDVQQALQDVRDLESQIEAIKDQYIRPIESLIGDMILSQAEIEHSLSTFDDQPDPPEDTLIKAIRKIKKWKHGFSSQYLKNKLKQLCETWFRLHFGHLLK